MDNEYFASINEVSKRLSVPAHTLRYWEKQFPVAIRPTTGAGGRRYYRAETVDRLVIIRDLLYKHGMTIAGVKKLLRDGKFPASADEFMTSATVATPHTTQDVPPMPAPASAPMPAAQRIDTRQVDLAIATLEQARDLLRGV